MAELVDDVHLDYPVNALVSFHYFSKVDIHRLASGGLCLIADSGAFSAASQDAQIDTDEFYEWCGRWRDDFIWMASLDVIGDDAATYKNWISAPSHLRLVPTVHCGAAPETLDKYVEGGADLVGLGGMVPYKSEPMKLLRWCAQMMRYARDRHPHVRFHGWGVTHPELLMNLPWWSVDSSGFTAAYRYGRMTLVDPATGRKYGYQMNGKDAARYARELSRDYGIDWRKVSVSATDNRRDVVRVSVRSMQHLQTYLQRRWKVTPPETLITKQASGPLLHFVDAAKPHLECLHGPQLHAVIANAETEGQQLVKEES